MAPSNGTTSTPPKLVVTLPYNGTLRWHSNGTASSDPAMAPIRQSGSSPSPVLEVNPCSYRYLGNEWIGIVYLVGKFSKLKQILGVTHNPTVTYDFAKS